MSYLCCLVAMVIRDALGLVTEEMEETGQIENTWFCLLHVRWSAAPALGRTWCKSLQVSFQQNLQGLNTLQNICPQQISCNRCDKIYLTRTLWTNQSCAESINWAWNLLSDKFTASSLFQMFVSSCLWPLTHVSVWQLIHIQLLVHSLLTCMLDKPSFCHCLRQVSTCHSVLKCYIPTVCLSVGCSSGRAGSVSVICWHVEEINQQEGVT